MLFVLNCLGVGGSEIKIIKTANALSGAGIPVELAYLNKPDTSLGTVSPRVAVTNLRRHGPYSVPALSRLRRCVKRERRAVIVVNLYPLLYAVPAVKSLLSGDRELIALINTSVSLHEDMVHERVYAKFLRRCDKLVFGCNAEMRKWIDKHNLSSERAQVIYNGVDHGFFSPGSDFESPDALRRRLGIPRDAPVIGSIGRLEVEKSFDMLIAAFERSLESGSQAHLILAGRGEDRPRLEQLAKAASLEDRVHFLGLVSDVRPALSLLDIFVLPSSAIETFSNSALEAMSMGRPVLLSNIGGAAEMVQNERSGLLFPVGDLDALTANLSRLLDSDELRARLGAEARERCITSFAFEGMVEQYRNLVDR